MKRILFNLFFRLGIVPQRIYTPAQLYGSLKAMPVLIQEHELRKRAELIVRANDHRYYELLLRAFVNRWDFKVEGASFIRKGIGESSLNTCRKVVIDGKAYFEKVFFNSRPEVETAEWFQRHIYGQLGDSIITASLEKLIKGEVITIAYYEFLELSPFQRSDGDQAYIKLTIDLYSISKDTPLDAGAILTPQHVRDFRFHFQYQRYAGAAEAKLRELGVNFRKLVDNASSSKKILTHGDINLGNAFKGPILVDWDSFGVYPIGLDVAYLCYRMPLREWRYKLDIKRWLEDNYGAAIDPVDWTSFERNFYFFLYVFAFPLFQEGDYLGIERELIEKNRGLDNIPDKNHSRTC